MLNLIVLFGASRILLLGYDMRADGKRRHWHRDHDRDLHNPDDALLADFARRFDSIQPLACEVLNCTPGSAVKRFPMADLRSVE